jgi:hypothetical protein
MPTELGVVELASLLAIAQSFQETNVTRPNWDHKDYRLDGATRQGWSFA